MCPRREAKVFKKFVRLLFLLSGLLPWTFVAEAQPAPADLTKLSLEELLNIEISSVAKKEQKLADAAAAIYVITQEDIRRSGAMSIPEVLRMAPGLSVARIDSNKWSITARGFSSSFANNLLVLIDGRSVYTPLFSGVYWDVQDTVLDDVDRIEVIRGPAGAVWGANAVNGVINIITKHAQATQGGLLTAGGGSQERGFGEMRYGGAIGNDVRYRVFGKYFNRENFAGAFEINANDAWHVGRGGFRIDSSLAQDGSLTLQGEYYDGKVGTKVETTSLTSPFSALAKEDTPIAGGNVLARWRRSLSPTANLKVQLYYDRTKRESMIVKETRDTVDLEFQHQFAWSNGHELIWGLGYRLTAHKITGNSFTVSLNPKSRDDHLLSAFFQNDFALVRDRLRLTLGAKLERNDYSGFEIQPNARLLWTPHKKHSFWGAVSRAVRTPSIVEHDVRANLSATVGPTPTCPLPLTICLSSLFGDKKFSSEHLVAYELGYRSQVARRMSVDIATFYHLYSGLRTIEPGTPFLELTPAPAHLVIPLRPANKLDAEAFGIEFAALWNPVDFWKLNAGYTFYKLFLHKDKSSVSPSTGNPEGDSPQNQFHLRSYLDLPYDLKLDAALYYIDRLSNQRVPAYTRFDLRLGYSPTKNLDFSIGGQNLFDRRHREFGSNFLIIPTKIERSIYGKLTWRF